MAHKLFNLFNKKNTPQNQPIPGSTQVPNSAGGYSWELDPWQRLGRFLVLGTEGGTYYVSEQKLTRDNAVNVLLCLKEDYRRYLDTVVAVSAGGRAYKNDPAIFALALAAASDDPAARSAALEVLPQVARIGTHLFHFAEYVDGLRGWGRGLRRAVGQWYLDRPVENLALQLAKYQSRDGWSHRDLLRLAHPQAPSEAQNALLRWAAGKEVPLEQLSGLAEGLERLKTASSETEVIALIRQFRAPREIIPTQYLTSPQVWEALLPGLGLTALLRNLGNLSKCGLLGADSVDVIAQITGRITQAEALKKARVHPLQVLAALITYQQGHGMRGSGEWTPVPRVVEALNEAFHLSFETIVPTGKRIYIGLDVSGSMGMGQVSGIPGLSPRMASAALAMTTVRTEAEVVICGFSHELIKLNITPKMSLEQVVKAISDLPFGGTDCALPMLDALKHKIQADAFLVYTDNETWAGKTHPAQALKQYRKETNIPARLVVVGMAANAFTIADPNDAGMLDVVGFSTDTPSAIADFVAGRLGEAAPRPSEEETTV